MKKLIVAASMAMIVLALCETVFAQTYPRMRIRLDDGAMVQGKKGSLLDDEVTLEVSGSFSKYSYDRIVLIEAKQGRAGKYALGFGGGCLAIGLLVTAVNTDDDIDTGELFLGSLLWAGIFAGVGAGIGALADPWRTVYAGKRGWASDHLDLLVSSNKHAPFMIGVVYKF